jgi:hypothetical protein
MSKESWPINSNVQYLENNFFFIPVEEYKKKDGAKWIVCMIFEDKSYLKKCNGLYCIINPKTAILIAEDGSWWGTQTETFEKTSSALTCL